MGAVTRILRALASAPTARRIPMHNEKAFFDTCRLGVMGPKLDGDEVAGAKAILHAMSGAPIAWTAYALATAYHETAHSLQPIPERGGNAYFFRMYDPKGLRPHIAKELGNTMPGDGVLFRGRGLVQLTGRRNYTRAAEETGYPLVGNPDLAMRPDIAALIMRRGMEQGWFTTKAFKHFLPSDGPATHRQFFEARRIINGRDRAEMIADFAVNFQEALSDGGWA